MSEHGPRAVLLGDGLIADAIAEVLSGSGEVLRYPCLAPGDIASVGVPVVVASDAWDVGGRPGLRKACAQVGVPWLGVHAELGRVVLGPVELPGVPGCWSCAELRRRLARPDSLGHAAVRERHGAELAERPSSWLTPQAAFLVAALVGGELELLAVDPARMRTRGALLYVDLDTLRVGEHRVLPDPLCPDCGGLPMDAAALAEITSVPRPKLGPRAYRIRDVADELDDLLALYVDEETGLIRKVVESDDGGLPVAGAPMGLRDGGVEHGYGRSRGYRSSRLTALLEALERYGGMRPGGKRTAVRAAYADIADRALDPRLLGLYPEEWHRAPGFRHPPFRETTSIPWVWGYSFARREPILVPESYAYYRTRPVGDPDGPFVYETSNGCALGGCLEEAILHGVLEVAERDAFLMTWYLRTPAPRIDLGSAGQSTSLVAEAIEHETGYRIMAFDTTREQGVPCVWAMAVDPIGDGKRPAAVCAAGAHLDPERAVENALSELGPILTDRIRRHPAQRDLARRMADDPSLVTDMAHHSTLYGDPGAAARLGFLLDSPEVRRTADVGDTAAFRNADLRDDLGALLDRYLASGLDVVVVDQTTPEHRIGGLSCVKVVIPGMVPMTFGHAYRRVHGLPRLRPAGGAAGINPHPHPFP